MFRNCSLLFGGFLGSERRTRKVYLELKNILCITLYEKKQKQKKDIDGLPVIIFLIAISG